MYMQLYTAHFFFFSLYYVKEKYSDVPASPYMFTFKESRLFSVSLLRSRLKKIEKSWAPAGNHDFVDFVVPRDHKQEMHPSWLELAFRSIWPLLTKGLSALHTFPPEPCSEFFVD